VLFNSDSFQHNWFSLCSKPPKWVICTCTQGKLSCTRCWFSTMSRPWKGQLRQFRVHHTQWPGPGTKHFSPSCVFWCPTAYITIFFFPLQFRPWKWRQQFLRNIGNTAHCHALQNPKNRINIKISAYSKSSYFAPNFTHIGRKCRKQDKISFTHPSRVFSSVHRLSQSL
jgi:hypothetical protein